MTLDHGQREAKRIVGNGVARAYGFRHTDDFADDCPRCRGDGTITVGGYPSSGVLVNDPQEPRDERCPDCHGTGQAAA